MMELAFCFNNLNKLAQIRAFLFLVELSALSVDFYAISLFSTDAQLQRAKLKKSPITIFFHQSHHLKSGC